MPVDRVHFHEHSEVLWFLVLLPFQRIFEVVDLFFDFFHVLLDAPEGFDGFLLSYGVGDAHGFSGVGVDEADFAQVEAAFDDAEGVGFCDAQFRVQFDVIEGGCGYFFGPFW